VGMEDVGAGDEVLVRGALVGDAQAYAGLVARYRGQLERYAVRMLGNRQDAEEAVQDALIRAYRSLRRCEDPARFGPWLFGILVNRCRTLGGRRARREQLFVHQDTDDPVTLHPAERIAWREAVQWALGQIAPKYREAFLLRHMEERSYEEMVELTGVKIQALRMRVSRACDQLRELLREHDHA
jgi:RNA polymerase sigma-70 factor, ECF subfamily